MTNEQYEQVLKVVPKEVKEKFIFPLANKYPTVHRNIMTFLLTLQEKGYVITKAPIVNQTEGK